MERQTVKVYVRAGTHEGERTISFRPPKEVPQVEWIRRGFAIDGNSVIASVTALTRITQFETLPGLPSNPDKNIIVIDDAHVKRETMTGYPEESEIYHDPDLYTDPKVVREAGFNPRSLVQGLQEVEAWLIDWLGTLGYDVEFA